MKFIVIKEIFMRSINFLKEAIIFRVRQDFEMFKMIFFFVGRKR